MKTRVIRFRPKLNKAAIAALNEDQLKNIFNEWAKMYAAYIKREFQRNSRGGGDWPDLAESTKRARAKKKAAKLQVKRVGGKLVSVNKKKKKRVRRKPKKRLTIKQLQRRAKRTLQKAREEFSEKRIKKRLKRTFSKKGLKRAGKGLKRAGKGLKKRIKRWRSERRKRAKEKARKFAILRDTGTLFNALSIGAKGNLCEVTKNGVTYGFTGARHNDDDLTIRELAAIHDEGTDRIPQRKILKALTPELANRMLGAFRRNLQRKTR